MSYDSSYHKGRVYIGNVSDDIDDASLRALFSEFGTVAHTKTGLCGFAFVDFEDDKDVDKAVESLNGTTYKERRITVERARGPRRIRSYSSYDQGRSRSSRDGYSSSRRPSSMSRSRPRRGSVEEDDRADRYHRKRDSRSPSPSRRSSQHSGAFPQMPFGMMPNMPFPMMPNMFMPPNSGSFAPDRDRSGAPSNVMGMMNPYFAQMASMFGDPKAMMEQMMMYSQAPPQHQDDDSLPPPISEHSWQSSPSSPPQRRNQSSSW
ncbi:hypothetical protein RCL1_001351 [Eukaryota sp. TZLM3-RCL]